MTSVTPTRPEESGATESLDDVEGGWHEESQSSQQVHFDPDTGRLLGPRYDPLTGERLHSPTTQWWPPAPRRGFVVVQGIWFALVGLFLAVALVTLDEFEVTAAEAIAGAAIWWVIGAVVITTISFIYRKLRHLP